MAYQEYPNFGGDAYDNQWNPRFGRSYSDSSYFSCSPTTTWSSTSSPQLSGATVTLSPCIVSLLDRCVGEAKSDINEGLAADSSWLGKNNSRGRPAKYTEDGKKIALWRNNWVYEEKKKMDADISKANGVIVQRRNEELNDRLFELCIEQIELSQHLCKHNLQTAKVIMQQTSNIQNSDTPLPLCQCDGNHFPNNQS